MPILTHMYVNVTQCKSLTVFPYQMALTITNVNLIV